MRIHIATDHAGLEFSQLVQKHLRDAGHEVVDHGPQEYDALDDYPAFCINAAQAVATDQRNGVSALGVVFGGSGNGEQIAANKVAGIRAALVWNLSTAELAREHNNANVISIGGNIQVMKQSNSSIVSWQRRSLETIGMSGELLSSLSMNRPAILTARVYNPFTSRSYA